VSKPRRSRGLGTVRQRGGRWEGRYHLQVGGVTKQASVYGRTRADVERLLREAQVARDRGTLVTTSARVTVGVYLAEWLKAAEPGLRPRTRVSYRQITRDHLLPALGAVALTRLTALQVQALYADLGDAGKSRKTIGNCHGVLHKALDQAVKWNLVNRNVADAVDVPRGKPPEMKTLSPEDARTVLQTADGDQLEPLWRLAIAGGLRQGEICALRWPQVDLESGVLQVTGTLEQRPGHKPVVAEPKTARGRRAVQLGAATVASLRAYRVRCIEAALAEAGRAYDPTGFVFQRPDGQPYTMSMVWKAWRKLNDKAGVPRIRFHDLRHTAATLLFSKHVHPKMVQEMLGHATIATTMDIYSHAIPALHVEAAAIMDDLLSQR
jgi:integrase